MDTFYFGDASRRLFGALAAPQGAPRAALVVCPPWGEEMVCTYARLARWSKELASEGIAVLRYHPFGTGESDGQAGDFTLSGAARDARAALRWMRQRYGRVGLLGLRFGGAVAVRASADAAESAESASERPDFVVLWSPIVHAGRYARELLRMRLTTELVHSPGQGVRTTIKALTEELEAGRAVDILGYEVSPAFHRELAEQPSLSDMPPPTPVLWLSREPEQESARPIVEAWRQRLPRVAFRLESHAEPAFWEEFSAKMPRNFMATTRAWMVSA